jgi:hypothetical protein
LPDGAKIAKKPSRPSSHLSHDYQAGRPIAPLPSKSQANYVDSELEVRYLFVSCFGPNGWEWQGINLAVLMATRKGPRPQQALHNALARSVQRLSSGQGRGRLLNPREPFADH